MVAIVATSNASPSLQASLSKVRLEQARREADRAEADAQNLRAQADEAEREARTGRDKVRQLSSSSDQDAAPPKLTPSASTEGTTYTQQLRSAQTSETPPKVQNFMERLYKATSDKFTASGNPLKTNEDDNTVVNSQGQATGRILNVQA